MRSPIPRYRRPPIVLTVLMLCAGIGVGIAAAPAHSTGSGVPHQPSGPTPDQLCGSWADVANYPTAIGGNAVVTVGSYLYSFGGYNGMMYTNAAYRYDGTSWTPIAPLPAERYEPAIATDGTNIYITGGNDASNYQQPALWRYNPGTNTYTTLAPMLVAVGYAASAYLSGEFYVIGGCTGPCDDSTKAVQIYNIAANSWSSGPSFPNSADSLRAVSLGGFIYVGPSLQALTKTYRYDGGAWNDAAIADVPVERAFYAAGVLNGEIVLAGGYDGVDPIDTAAAWDPATNTWAPLPNLNHLAIRTAGDTLNGAFYLVGGDLTFSFNASPFTQRFTPQACSSITPTDTVVPPSATPPPTQTVPPTQIPTGTAVPPSATATAVPPSSTATSPPGSPTAPATPTATACALSFADVPPLDPFYPYIRCLTCRGLLSGYPCGGAGEPCPGVYFRPHTNATRGQITKILNNAAGYTEPLPSAQQTFADVPPGSTFWTFVERLATRGIIGGYPCGGPGEPCVAPQNRPYFRPNNQVTRGQLAKMNALTAGWTETPTGQTFADVPPGSTFYVFIERTATRGVISGYPCGGPGEPCFPPANRAYFRPATNVTRAQTAKIVAGSFFPTCQTPQR